MWKDDFSLFIMASGINNVDQKKALLLHIAGKEVREIYRAMPANADFISRIRSDTPENYVEESETDEFVNFVTRYAIPKTMSIEKIKESSNVDSLVKSLKEAIRTGKWFTKNVKQFEKMKLEFTEQDGIVLYQKKDTLVCLKLKLHYVKKFTGRD